MARDSRPPAEAAIDASLVEALLAEQHRDLVGLPLVDLGEGWDNRLFRLGEALAVRLPRRAASAALIEHELRWLPVLAPGLSLKTPVPLRAGRAGCGFPWRWSIVPWLPGSTAWASPLADPRSVAIALGRFVAELHSPAPHDAPRNPWRGVPLALRNDVVARGAESLDGDIDVARVLALWHELAQAPAWQGPPLWIHGDLHPGNLLLQDGRLTAVLDFGDLTSGDPATDLSVAWMLLPPWARALFRASASGVHHPIDDDTWRRARGWALSLGVAYLARSEDDDRLAAMARATIRAALGNEASPHTAHGSA